MNRKRRTMIIMRKLMRSILLSLSVSLSLLPVAVLPVSADVTPTVIYSTIESGSVTIKLDKAIYPIKQGSTRTWLCNGEAVVIDGTNFKDFSEGQTAKLSIAATTTVDHMKNYTVVDTTTPTPSGEIVPNQIARLYVISKENYEAAELTTKPMTATVGDTVYSSDITLYIDSTAYPNFQPLRFVNSGNVKDSIKVEEGIHTYNLTDTISGKSATVIITGINDDEPPKITSLKVLDNMADKYALNKTLEVTATDDKGLPKEAYYWEDNENLSNIIKERVMDGEKAQDISGMTWTENKTYKVTSNGTYTVFVRDNAGNIAYKDIRVSKISNSEPYITALTLGRTDSDAYIDVKASDSGNQPLKYKINDGEWQDKNRLWDVKEGINSIYVKNEAGVEVFASKEVFLSVFMDREAGLSPEALYNFIQVSPVTWTNKSVKVSLVLPDDLYRKLSSSPYSINGEAFSSNRTATVNTNGDTVTFSVKDIYGNTHTSKPYIVFNIDKEEPSVEVQQAEGMCTVKAQDSVSGIAKIVVSSTNATNYMIKANDAYGVKSDIASYKAPANGSYQFTVYDFAGNSANATIQVKAYDKDGNIQSALKESKVIPTSTGSSGGGGSSGNRSGSSTIGKKSSAEGSQGTHAMTSSSGESGFSMVSNAGKTQRGNLLDAEWIEIIKNKESLKNSPAQMVESLALDNSNSEKLKKMAFILFPLLVIALIVMVVAINSDKLAKTIKK